MVTLLKIKEGELSGWLMGQDTHDLRRQLQAVMDYDDSSEQQAVINALYQMEFPVSGKHQLSDNFILLVR